MNEETRVYEVKKVFTREVEDEKTETIILQKLGDKWVYHAPNAQNHTVEQLEEILSHLKTLA